MPPPKPPGRLARFFFKHEPEEQIQPVPVKAPHPAPAAPPPPVQPDLGQQLASIQHFRRQVLTHGITEAVRAYESSELIRMTLAAGIKPHHRYVWKTDIGRALMRTWRR